MVQWTEEQREAIETRGKNILVSAAAGSGKTAVLVERIKRLILEDGCSVDRMLIVTFTNAAASEMKEKIRKSLSEALDGMSESPKTPENPGLFEEQDDKRRFLKRQLDLLATANISTFHAFALEVIRRYFYIIDVEPNFKICDSTQESLLKNEAMDEMLESLFDKGETEFYRFLKSYSGDRDESRFRKMIMTCYDTLRSLPEPFQWLDENVSRLKDGRGFEEGSAKEQLFAAASEKIKMAKKAIEINLTIARAYGLTALESLCMADNGQLDIVLEADEKGNYNGLKAAVESFKLPTMSSKIFSGVDNGEVLKKTVTDNRNSAKKQIKELKDVYFARSFDQLKQEMAATYDSGVYLQKLLVEYDRIYREKKLQKNVTDFSDIEHNAYEILKDGEAAGFYRERFEHIFIDEYQDSNVIQEALIDLIKRPDNLFMVGDVKQSIYKFRLAEPEIFQKKYKSYRDGLEKDSVKIDLNKNFRSKKTVIDFINGIFSSVMEGYDDNAALYPGDVYAGEAYDSPKLYLAKAPWDEDSDIDDELKNLIKAEKEALCAVRIIRDSLGQPIFDSKRGEKRSLEKKDIVILMRGVRNYGDIFYKILAENDIPAYIDDNDGFFDTMEINSFLSALYIIDNPKQDVPLLTLMRSEMLGFSIEEMVKIRLSHKTGSYFDAFSAYAAGGADRALAGKCKGALEKISVWRKLAGLMPLDKLIWKLLIDTGFYLAMGAMPSGSQRQANLRALTDKALAYANMGGGTLYGFIRYIEAVKENKVSMGQVKLLGENDDVVRIMTIHKSKGLEFPMVLLAGYCRRLNYSTLGKAPIIHKDIGIGFPIVDSNNRWYKSTLIQNMIKDKFRREEADEEKRVLYVALTRAMDRLVLLGICNDTEKEVEKVLSESPKDSSYMAMTGKVICGNMKAQRLMDDRMLTGISKGRRVSIDRMLSVIDSAWDKVPPDQISPEIDRIMGFSYPFTDELKIKSKYSVSELNRSAKQALPETLREPVFGKKEISAEARGSVYHCVLEHIDVGQARLRGAEYIHELVTWMVSEEILLPEEAEIVDVGRIKAFADSDLGERIAASPAVYREVPFNMLTTYDGKQITVQGIIDCYFEEGSYLVLVDYKTGRAEGARDKYGMQIELYRQALSEAAGREVKEAYLYMSDAGEIIKM